MGLGIKETPEHASPSLWEPRPDQTLNLLAPVLDFQPQNRERDNDAAYAPVYRKL